MKVNSVADDYQTRVVIPHCAVCARPCCNLDDVVLDLEWRQARAIYQITKSQKQFDSALPPSLKKAHGRYYAHTAPCPAYVDKKCSVYNSDAKPQSCSDFPVYKDGDALTVDTRCEAVDVDEVERLLRAQYARVTRTPDPEFPVLVTFDVETKP